MRSAAILLLLTGALASPLAGQAPSIRRTLDRWLTCVECTSAELDSVKALGRRIPATVDTLEADLFIGPSTERRDRLTRQLQSTWRRLAAAAARDSTREAPAFSQPQFVGYYLGNMVQIYQGRAALALGAIGGSSPRRILDRALGMPAGAFTPGVAQQVRLARDSLAP